MDLQPEAPANETRFDWLIAKLSATLVNASDDAIDDEIQRAIREISEFAALDCAYVTEVSPDGQHLLQTHQWVPDGISPVAEIPLHRYPWSRVRVLERRQPLVFARVDDLPAEAAPDRESFERLGIKSGATFPLVVGTSVHGLIAFMTVKQVRTWPPSLLEGLRLVGDMIASAIVRKRSQQELRRALDFERLIAELSAGFVNVTPEGIDTQITNTMGRVADFLGADRGSVSQVGLHDREFRLSHLWVREDRADWLVPAVIPAQTMPWLVEQISRGQTVTYSRPDELPPEATLEREFIARHGPKSFIGVPLTAGGSVIGAVTFGALQHERTWPATVVDRLRFIAEIFASALARKRADLELREALAENERLRQRLEAENVYLQAEVADVHNVDEIVGRTQAIRAVLHKVAQVAATDASVLLLGETGTGKELIARALHAGSGRRGRPLITVNCAALPPSLIESELFGHEKGAFTGATHARPGRFELANGSTLFLDEIGDLELPLQAKLLRALQEGEVQRLGSSRTHKFDIRIIAATNRDLKAAVADGRFRADLFYRLAVFPIALPPLRERREDIPLLIWHTIQSRQRVLRRSVREIPQVEMDALVAYNWPGNVRELQNVIERALILSPGPQLRLDEAFGHRPVAALPKSTAAAETLRDAERAHILSVLERCAWTIEGRNQAADRLGLRPSTLRNQMRKLDIRRPAGSR